MHECMKIKTVLDILCKKRLAVQNKSSLLLRGYYKLQFIIVKYTKRLRKYQKIKLKAWLVKSHLEDLNELIKKFC